MNEVEISAIRICSFCGDMASGESCATCAQLADFLRSTEPWSAWPIVAELAALDYRRAQLRANADEATITKAMLAAVEPAARARSISASQSKKRPEYCPLLSSGQVKRPL